MDAITEKILIFSLTTDGRSRKERAVTQTGLDHRVPRASGAAGHARRSQHRRSRTPRSHVFEDPGQLGQARYSRTASCGARRCPRSSACAHRRAIRSVTVAPRGRRVADGARHLERSHRVTPATESLLWSRDNQEPAQRLPARRAPPRARCFHERLPRIAGAAAVAARDSQSPFAGGGAGGASKNPRHLWCRTLAA